MTASELAEPIREDHHGRRVANGSVVVIEVRGTVHRPTVGAIAHQVRELVEHPHTTVTVDPCAVQGPHHWLVRALAKAHVAARARGAHLQVIVGNDTTSTLLDTTGISRITPVYRARDSHQPYHEPIPAPRRSRDNKRQRTTDWTTSNHHPRRRLVPSAVLPPTA